MYQRILVPLDGTDTADLAPREAMRLAEGGKAHLLLLHVIDDYPTMREFASNEALQDLRAHRRRRGEELVASRLRMVREAGLAATDIVCFAMESAPLSILEAAAVNDCDLIVMGSHGRQGVKRAILGSVAESVCRNSVVPVMVVPSPAGM